MAENVLFRCLLAGGMFTFDVVEKTEETSVSEIIARVDYFPIMKREAESLREALDHFFPAEQ